MLGMNQYNQNKTDGLGTWPEFKNEMDFYVPVGVVFIELEDCSEYVTGIESLRFVKDETGFVPSNDNRDYTFVLAAGNWR